LFSSKYISSDVNESKIKVIGVTNISNSHYYHIKDRQTDGQRDRWTDRQTNEETDRQNRQMDGQTDRQTNRQK